MVHEGTPKIGDVMRRSFVSLSPDASLAEAGAALALGEAREWPVARGGRLHGLVSMADLLSAERGGGRRGGAAASRGPSSIAAVVESPTVVARPRDPVTHAAEQMARERLSLLPVVEDGLLVGVLTTCDLVRVAVRLIHQHEDRSGVRMVVSELMTSPPLAIARSRDKLHEVHRRMRQAMVRHVPVVDCGVLVGLLSDHDVLSALRFEQRGWDVLVGEVMSYAPAATSPEASAAHAGLVMLRRAVGALPVLRGDRLEGMLTRSDYLRAMLARFAPTPGAN